MCECTCGDIKGDIVFRLEGSPDVVCVDIYRGCKDCAQLIGLDIRVFDEAGASDWLDEPIETVKGDLYGHLPTYKSIEILSVHDLIEASKSLEPPGADPQDGWFQDWLSDNGLDLLQAAFRLAQKRRGMA